MRRFTSLCVLAAFAVPNWAHAQPVKRIGVIYGGGGFEAAVQGMVTGLKQAGLVEGKHFVLHVRDTKGNVREIEPAAKQLVSERVDLLFTVTTTITLAANKATRDIPIVFAIGSDPVRFGLVKSHATPGGRLTGVQQQSFDLLAKRMDILKQILPGARRLLVIYNPDSAVSQQSLASARDAARKLGLELLERPAASVEDASTVLRGMRPREVDAWFQVTDPVVFSALPRLIPLANERRLPLIASDLSRLEHGALAVYGANYFEVGRMAAKHVRQVMAGAPPGGIPVEIYDQIQLGLNLRAAKELGITVPQPLVLRADQVIR